MVGKRRLENYVGKRGELLTGREFGRERGERNNDGHPPMMKYSSILTE